VIPFNARSRKTSIQNSPPCQFLVDYLSLAYCLDVVAQMERSARITAHFSLSLKDLSMKVGFFIFSMTSCISVSRQQASFGRSFDAAIVAYLNLWRRHQVRKPVMYYI